MVAAEPAGAKHAIGQGDVAAFRAFRTRRRHARLISQEDAHLLDEPGGQPVIDLGAVGEDNLAIRLEQGDVADRGHGSRGDIIDDLVGDQDTLVLGDLHVAAGRDHLLDAIEDELVGGNKHGHVLGRHLARRNRAMGAEKRH